MFWRAAPCNRSLAMRASIFRLIPLLALFAPGALAGPKDTVWIEDRLILRFAGIALLPERELRLGVESFAVIPVAGERMFDPAFDERHESATFYVGPSVSFGRGRWWR